MFMKKSPKSLFAVCDCGLYFYDFARSLKKTSLICVSEVHPKSWTQPLRCIFYEERTQNKPSV